MKRDLTLIEKRREYVRKEVQLSNNTTAKVQELSEKLFVSERTIWYDLTAKTESQDL
jgi:DeoR/GlpR family transcriptional regulator of sugar metabolism